MRLRPTPRSADRTRSPAAVSRKREYFKYQLETIDDFALRLSKFGVQRRRINLQKAAVGGHFSDLLVNNLQLQDCLADLGGFELAHSQFKHAL
jgi:hypothetical protein